MNIVDSIDQAIGLLNVFQNSTLFELPPIDETRIIQQFREGLATAEKTVDILIKMGYDAKEIIDYAQDLLDRVDPPEDDTDEIVLPSPDGLLKAGEE